MKQVTGANVNNITKIRQSDVFLGESTKVVGTVNVPANLQEGDALKIGTLLHSSDGGDTWNTRPALFDGTAEQDEVVYFEGHTYKSTAADANTNLPSTGTDWDDLGEWNANGVLYNDITSTTRTTVVVTSSLKEKYLTDYDANLKATLFNNKLFVK